MIFSKDVLFIHVPKTGGMATTQYLLDVLPRPVYYTHPERDSRIVDPAIQIPGSRHETLRDARDTLGLYRLAVEDFRLVLAAIRSPYGMEVSRYAYLQKGNPGDRDNYQDIAMTEDFETFALRTHSPHGGPHAPLQSYFLLDGKRPPNLRIVRAESLAQEVVSTLAEIGISGEAEFPVDNASHHDDFATYYTPQAEASRSTSAIGGPLTRVSTSG